MLWINLGIKWEEKSDPKRVRFFIQGLDTGCARIRVDGFGFEWLDFPYAKALIRDVHSPYYYHRLFILIYKPNTEEERVRDEFDVLMTRNQDTSEL
jgi:hypothetical protein